MSEVAMRDDSGAEVPVGNYVFNNLYVTVNADQQVCYGHQNQIKAPIVESKVAGQNWYIAVDYTKQEKKIIQDISLNTQFCLKDFYVLLNDKSLI